ncbi:helix-turn-helix domain-containing protein [Isoptericola sp. F-RaC21]|uniref:ArsR/SmtB family transcription factor n=1 Tax=Isoptericola sp. F-RaC21 TaxID=3141452 RepID=UPI00315BDC7A
MTASDGLHPATEDIRLPTVLAALADPARLATVQTLAQVGESACTQLQEAAGLSISRSTFSHHQKVLREAGIISVRIHGTQRLLSLRRTDLDACCPGLLDAVTSARADSPQPV